jgi:hypothetical protein
MMESVPSRPCPLFIWMRDIERERRRQLNKVLKLLRLRPHRAGRRSRAVRRQVTWRAPLIRQEQLSVAPDLSGILCPSSVRLNRTIVTCDGTLSDHCHAAGVLVYGATSRSWLHHIAMRGLHQAQATQTRDTRYRSGVARFDGIARPSIHPSRRVVSGWRCVTRQMQACANRRHAVR